MYPNTSKLENLTSRTSPLISHRQLERAVRRRGRPQIPETEGHGGTIYCFPCSNHRDVSGQAFCVAQPHLTRPSHFSHNEGTGFRKGLLKRDTLEAWT